MYSFQNKIAARLVRFRVNYESIYPVIRIRLEVSEVLVQLAILKAMAGEFGYVFLAFVKVAETPVDILLVGIVQGQGHELPLSGHRIKALAHRLSCDIEVCFLAWHELGLYES